MSPVIIQSINKKGDVVDNIENNAFTVIENVETADEKLKSAHENQKSARKVYF